jgi:hypothetical protein
MRNGLTPYCESGELTGIAGSNTTLAPAQRRAADQLARGMAAANIGLLRAPAGMGKTTILRELQRKTAGAFVMTQHFMTLLKERPPAAIEETFMEVLQRAMDLSDTVIVDDLHLVTEVVQGYEYPRANLLNAAMSVVLGDAEVRNKKFIFAVNGETEPAPVRHRALSREMDEFEPEDFASVCHHYLPETSGRLDFGKIHRFAPALNAYQLKNACLWVRLHCAEPTTEFFIEYLHSQNSPATWIWRKSRQSAGEI